MQYPVSDTPDQHTSKVTHLFARITRCYDLLNTVLSFGQDRYWRYRLVRTMHSNTHRTDRGIILDLAAGTLDVSREIGRQYPGTQVIAMDICEPMLRRGREKLLRRLPKQTTDSSFTLPVLSDGRFLPLPDNSIHTAGIAFGLRNIIPRSAVYTEILRVLTPGGRFCILEFASSRNNILGGLYNFYLNRLLPPIGRLLSGDRQAYSYLARSISTFPNPTELLAELHQAGFSQVMHLPLAAGIVRIHVAQKE